MKAKRGRGRPSFTGETGQRYQVTIPPTVADKLRALGEGSLSQGIIRAAANYKDAVMQLRAIARMGCAEAETDAANDAQDCLRRLGEPVDQVAT